MKSIQFELFVTFVDTEGESKTLHCGTPSIRMSDFHDMKPRRDQLAAQVCEAFKAPLADIVCDFANGNYTQEAPQTPEALLQSIINNGFAVTLDPDGVKLRQMRIDATTPQSPLDARCFPLKSRYYSAVLAEVYEAVLVSKHAKQ